MRTIAIASTLTLVLTACGAPPSDHDQPSVDLEMPQVHNQPIYGGTPASSAFYDATIGIVQQSGDSVTPDTFCSGTLVTPSVVVTAAHCLDVGRRKVRARDPLTVAVYFGTNPQTDPDPIFIAVSELKIHEGYNSSSLLNDIAVMRLAFDIPTSIATPVPGLPASAGLTGADIGGTLNFAGFGVTETGSSDERLETDGVLGGLGCTVAGCYGADDPATQISYEQQTAGPCFGDSGGPAFFVRDGMSYLAGVTSWGDNNCTQFGVSTRVDAYEGWIAAFAGVTPPPPPTCVADGFCDEGCADDPDCAPPPSGDCGDGVCGTGESCDGRGATSVCSADCAGKTNGKPSNRFCYVEGVCEGPGC